MLSYLAVRTLVCLFRFIPLRVLHGVGAFLSFLLQKVFRYRAQTVADNLRRAFPSADTAGAGWEDRYYRHLADLMLESVKGLTMTRAAMRARFRFRDADQFEPYYRQGRDVLLLGAHQSNWEWGVATFQTAVLHQVVGIYKPLRNKRLDTFLASRRRRWGLQLLPFSQAGRAFAGGRERPRIVVLIADQRPARPEKAQWVDFFGIRTPFYLGPEKLARRYDLPVFTFTVQRCGSGNYEVRFRLLSDQPRSLPAGALTSRYVARIEADIRRQPTEWLWSHRRWKGGAPVGSTPDIRGDGPFDGR